MFVSPGDLLVLISSSGNSSNILSTLKYAEIKGINYIFLTSALCNCINELKGIKIVVSSIDIQIIEDVHNLFGHLVYKSFSS
jgi:phosphoheptose isomerase